MEEDLIVYALVAHGTLVLAEYSSSSGNFVEVAHDLLKQIDIQKETKMTINADTHSFHYIVRKEITYLCLTSTKLGASVPFAFLNKIFRLFEPTYGHQARHATQANPLKTQFTPVIKSQVKSFSEEQSEDKLQEVKGQLDQVKGVIQKDISMVLERGQKLENLMVQSEGLMDSSDAFRSGATKLKSQMRWNHFQIKIIGAGICVVFLILLLMYGCGGVTFPKCL